jgi:hypothetical protein
MKYEEIEVGKTYHITYVDPNYPCHCPCHTNPFILHCAPCCYDNSYDGPALCVRKDTDEYQRIHFQDPHNDLHFYVVHAYNVLKEIVSESI